jgi:hypothetical protein
MKHLARVMVEGDDKRLQLMLRGLDAQLLHQERMPSVHSVEKAYRGRPVLSFCCHTVCKGTNK